MSGVLNSFQEIPSLISSTHLPLPSKKSFSYLSPDLFVYTPKLQLLNQFHSLVTCSTKMSQHLLILAFGTLGKTLRKKRMLHLIFHYTHNKCIIHANVYLHHFKGRLFFFTFQCSKCPTTQTNANGSLILKNMPQNDVIM